MQAQLSAGDLGTTWDLIVVGTGFASTFFLAELLKKPRPLKILVLEKGVRTSHADRLAAERAGTWDSRDDSQYTKSGLEDKDWQISVAFGGGSNCWWGCTPRFLPNDFRLRSEYGVGVDWPISYDDLSQPYADVEATMGIAGPSDYTLYPDRIRYPLPPHRLSEVDEAFRRAFPTLFYSQPTARASVASHGRAACCGNGVCSFCPIDAKFTIENGLSAPYDDSRVKLALSTEVRALKLEAQRVTGVLIRDQMGREQELKGNAVALGANAIFNASILMQSGMEHPVLGKRLSEQGSIHVDVDLRGLQAFGGSTSITGHGFMLYDGSHRSKHAAALVEFFNLPHLLRVEQGRHREIVRLKLIFEELPQEGNRVELGREVPDLRFEAFSDYLHAGITNAKATLPRLFAKLPIEDMRFAQKINPTEAHVLCTTAMGTDPKTSIVDRHLVCHTHRNLFVLGGSVFPTCPPANPTLTLSALSLWAARKAELS